MRGLLAGKLRNDAGLAIATQSEASLLLAKGDRRGAEEAFLKALGLWEQAGWPYYNAKSLVAYSDTIAQTKPDDPKKRRRKMWRSSRNSQQNATSKKPKV